MTCPDFGLPAVSVTVGADSLVSDVLSTAAGEWDIYPEEVELSFAGDILCETMRLADHGVGADSELEMWKKRFRLFGKCWFVDDRKRERLLCWLRDNNTEDLCLETSTFSKDGCLSIENSLLPSDAKRISFRNSTSDMTIISQVTTVGNKFLSSCTSITALDLPGLNSVTTIGDFFLGSCPQLTALDLSGLSSVTTIGRYFLPYSRITALDLSGLSSVTTIGTGFLYFCTRITALDLSGFNSVNEIGKRFLHGCVAIKSPQLLRNSVLRSRRISMPI